MAKPGRRCGVCGVEFRNIFDYMAHMGTHRPPVNKPKKGGWGDKNKKKGK